MQNKLKYYNYSIVFQEVPDEVSLALNITNCPHKCEGCHSDYLFQDIGNYVDNDLEKILNKYDGMITCVCFMGGDQAMDDFINLIQIVHSKYHLKTCIYSGSNDIKIFKNAIPHLDYIKIGSYKKAFGGLDHITTNQKFYRVDNNKLIDETYLFQEKRKV